MQLFKSSLYLIILVLAIGIPGRASEYSELSALEKSAVDLALKKYELTISVSPENKIIDQIYIDNQSTFIEDEFFWWIDRIQTATTRDTIERDLFFKAGAPYNRSRIQDSESLLRASPTKSIVAIVPVQSVKNYSADSIDILVVTRDSLSWRVNTDLSVNGDKLDVLALSLEQNNILGMNKQADVSFSLAPRTIRFSAGYTDARVFNNWYRFRVKQGIIIDRNSSNFAGVFGGTSFALPLYTTSEEWGYGTATAFYYGPKYTIKSGKTQLIDNPEGAPAKKLEAKYQWLDVDGSAWLTRSYGSEFKNDVTIAYGFHLYRPNFFLGTIYSPLERATIINEVFPASEFESFISLGTSSYTNSLYTLYNFNTYYLAEQFRLGPSYSVVGSLGLQYPLFSEINFVRLRVAGGWNFGAHNYLIQPYVGGTTRFANRLEDTDFSVGVRAVSPTFLGIGRLVSRVEYQALYGNRFKQQLFLGGDIGVRGYPSSRFEGDQRSRVNLEFRTLPLDIARVFVGAAIFYDGGSVASEQQDIRWIHSAGFGLRILIVQFNRQPIRLDLGFPIKARSPNINNPRFSFGFEQAF